MAAAPAPLLEPRELDQLRTALIGYTVDTVRADPDDPLLRTLGRLFLLGTEVPEVDARAALHPLPLEAAAPLIAVSAGSARAVLDVRPYAEAGADEAWWVVSDFGSDVRPGPLAGDHVLGVGAASVTLAQATPRLPVGRALDVGTGCGVQALHLARHASGVTATDVSVRALRLAATTAALSGQQWDLRAGSLLDPVGGEEFDLVVANPPFVVSDGASEHDYRDSGLAGDAACATLTRHIARQLAPDGTGQLLANWVVPPDGGWADRVGGWLAGTGCDAWVWQREVAEPAEYVALWLRDAGEVPGTDRWRARYDAWLGWFAAHGVAAVGMGLITLWRTDAAEPTVVLEDVPQAIEQPCGAQVSAWIGRQRWLAGTDDDALLATPLAAASGLVLARDEVIAQSGWQVAACRLRQVSGLRWELEVDDAIAALVAGCGGNPPLAVLIAVLAGSLGVPVDEVTAAVLPVVRDLVARGFLTRP